MARQEYSTGWEVAMCKRAPTMRISEIHAFLSFAVSQACTPTIRAQAGLEHVSSTKVTL